MHETSRRFDSDSTDFCPSCWHHGRKAEQFKSLFVFVELGGSGFSLAFKISDWKLLEGRKYGEGILVRGDI